MTLPTQTLPESYIVPTIWEMTKLNGGKFAAINAPTSGARFDQELRRGEHSLQLHSLGTPNGMKVTIMLEELRVEYDAYTIDIGKGEQFSSGFVEVNPNSKIPIMIDYSMNPPIPLFESGSIVLYLAEKYAQFLPTNVHKKAECMNWVFWQMGTAPYIGGGFGHFFHYAPIKIEYAIDRFAMETKRIVDVLDKHLNGKRYICGDEYTIADIMNWPWMKTVFSQYGDGPKFLNVDSYTNVSRWLNDIGERDAVKRGIRVNGFGVDALIERHSSADFN